MDVDKLFKLPKLPSSSLNKRKWSEPSAESLKALKTQDTDSPSSASTSPSTNSKRVPSASVRDVQDQDQDDDLDPQDDGEFAPGNDADYFIEDDDEGGRFYGGGLTDTQKRILEVMNRDGAGQGEDKRPEQELSSIRKQLLKFEKCINKNQEMRVKFGDDPKKFIQSESDLNSALEELLILTTNPSLYYPELIKNGTTVSLCGLLSHENADISGKVIELIEELTDEDVLDNGEDGEEEDLNQQDEDVTAEGGGRKGKGKEGMKVLVEGLLENQLPELLIQNLSRFNDQLSGSSSKPTASELSDLESDSKSIYHLLGLIENLLSFKPELSIKILECNFLEWLLKRIERNDENQIIGGAVGGFDQNKAYAAEILAIICGNKGDAKVLEKIGKEGGIEKVLGVLAQYRKKVPKSSEELEFLENLFDILCSLLSLASNKAIFLSEEGIELMVILMRSSPPSSSNNKNSVLPVQLGSIKVLDHALSSISTNSIKASEKFVREVGLKPLFKILMDGSQNGASGKSRYFLGELIRTKENDEHILGILNSLFNCLESESEERLRLLGKFVEKDYEKCDRILELRDENLERLKGVEKEIEREKEELLQEFESLSSDDEELFYLRRLENGLFTIQLIDYILAWIVMEDDGIMNHVKLLLERKAKKGKGAFDQIIDVLKEYYDNMGDEPIETQDESPGMSQKEIIVALVNYLLGL